MLNCNSTINTQIWCLLLDQICPSEHHISVPSLICLMMGESCTFYIQSRSHCLGVWVRSSHFTSRQSHQLGDGILHISHSVRVTLSGRGCGWWYPPHFTSKVTLSRGGVSSMFHIHTNSHQSGGGILHISHPDKVTSMGLDPSHFTSSQSHIAWEGVLVGGILHISHPVKFTLWGWMDGISTFSHPVKVTSSGEWGILHISPTKLNAPQQWNQNRLHCYMPAQFKLVLA